MLICAASAGLLVAFVGYESINESNCFPLLVPFAVLAALGLITIKRSLISLSDGFAWSTFTLAGALVWVGWSAVQFGVPQKIANNFARLAPGFTPTIVPSEVVFAVLVSLFWFALVAWRLAYAKPNQL